jgi:integration host factor subunit alpha
MNDLVSNDTVTKNELSEALFDQVGLNKREAKDMIDAFFDRIGQSLETGVEVKIAARRVVTFHASQKLKDVVESHARENSI